jgi:hypothetical protein
VGEIEDEHDEPWVPGSRRSRRAAIVRARLKARAAQRAARAVPGATASHGPQAAAPGTTRGPQAPVPPARGAQPATPTTGGEQTPLGRG